MMTLPLAHILFGESAFEEKDGSFLQPVIKQFINTLLVHTWHHYHKGLMHEGRLLEKLQAELKSNWDGEY